MPWPHYFGPGAAQAISEAAQPNVADQIASVLHLRRMRLVLGQKRQQLLFESDRIHKIIWIEGN